jgi:tRNA threonylcarbamoyl adenosine modification protein YjeE
MLITSSGGSSFTVALPNEEATERFVADIASALVPGDLVTLSGDLGAGKTTFARAMIRHLAGDPNIAVPSPTFTLMQIYELRRHTVVHADLYRLDAPGELAELGFDDLPEGAITLLEWPDRAAGFLPADRLDIAFTLAPQLGPEHRNVRVTGYGTFAPRAERLAAIRRFLQASGFAQAERIRIQGDASSRSYERLQLDDQTAILMNAPRRPDGPPVRDGKPYSAIVHLAEDVKPFVAMANGLGQLGLSSPRIYEAEIEEGLLIIEDFGGEFVVAGDPPAPVEECYAAATDMLAALHTHRDLPETLPVAPHVEHVLPHYDLDALLMEAELLLDWYLPSLGVKVSDATRSVFVAMWREVLQPAIETDLTWVLRDFHSPNLMWLPDRQGIARVGLLDFQDAVIGPAAYDLASLLQDARVDVPDNIEVSLLGRYVQARREADTAFDSATFIRSYATMAAQRASKVLGIFARLDRRDGKPQYLRHIPRVYSYLQRSLTHPSLATLQGWYSVHVPRLGGS